jgi:hypothetical protein
MDQPWLIGYFVAESLTCLYLCCQLHACLLIFVFGVEVWASSNVFSIGLITIRVDRLERAFVMNNFFGQGLIFKG